MDDQRAYHARNYSRDTAKISTEQMRSFSETCDKWASKIDNASDRQTIVTVARSWRNVAQELDCRIIDGSELVDDLRVKLD